MRGICITLFALMSAGCTTSGYQRFYQPYCDVSQLKDVEFLAEGAEPYVWQVNIKEVGDAVKLLRARGYESVGYSLFNGGYENIANAKKQAKRLKALAVIVGAEYTDTQTSTVPLSIPTSQTTYGSGTVSMGSVHGNYSGSSTTYGSTIVPITTNQRRYDQGAVYFVKDKRKYRFGLQFVNLNSEQRKVLGRNTGAVVDVVIENSPAFYSNVLEGDVIIAVDGVPVRSVEEASTAMRDVPESVKSSTLRIIRSGVEKDIEVKL